MIRIQQLKLPVGHTEAELRQSLARELRIPGERIRRYEIWKKSIDARKKPVLYVYTVDVWAEQEKQILKKVHTKNIGLAERKIYQFPKPGGQLLKAPPVIVGTGPAGLFCGLMLARAGYRPLLLERGEQAQKRKKTVDLFWETGRLLPNSNVQFGEGGAGTFSDGKLNTLVKDPSGRNKKVLEILAEAGADPAVTYVSKPHVGTDVLSQVVKHIREEILRLGGEIRFGTKFENFETVGGRICAVIVSEPGASPEERVTKRIEAQAVVLAIGHSARDTFEMLAKKPLDLMPKAFAVGLRIQHPQKQINLSQYGMEDPGRLGAASYKLTHQTGFGRGVYSFCMCPGGFVVNASSEAGRLAVNGMSNHDRAGVNANSALIVTVTPEDFPDQTALGGVAFQRGLEEAAFQEGNGKIPVQIYEDFKENRISQRFGEVEPSFEGGFAFGNLREVLPKVLCDSLVEGIEHFGSVLTGFNRADAILAGVESRTSSPLRIPRDSSLESRIGGLYPCGEGAGYAGGITSAAMDGMKVAETIAAAYRPAWE